jgi:hypothetical protein
VTRIEEVKLRLKAELSSPVPDYAYRHALRSEIRALETGEDRTHEKRHWAQRLVDLIYYLK